MPALLLLCGRLVRRCLAALRPDPRDRFLAAAADHADLERRDRAFDRHTRRAATQWLRLRARW